MESDKIEQLLEKYFDGDTTLAEEKQLQHYFSSLDVAPHLEQYKPLFAYFSAAAQQSSQQQFGLKQPRKKRGSLLAVAASVAVLIGIGTYVYTSTNDTTAPQDLGTYDDPQVAFRETQKALALLSVHVNKAAGSVAYVNEYEHSKNLIFKQ